MSIIMTYVLCADVFSSFLFQASTFEALTQSFQVAFALRGYSLTEAGDTVKFPLKHHKSIETQCSM
jgi:hypothetical protein